MESGRARIFSFSFFNDALVGLGPMCFYIHFMSSLSISTWTPKKTWNFYLDWIESANHPIIGIFYPSIYLSSLISFTTVCDLQQSDLKHLLLDSFWVFENFVVFILGIVNSIIFKVLFPTYFNVFISYLFWCKWLCISTLLNSVIDFNNYLRVSWIFSVHNLIGFK